MKTALLILFLPVVLSGQTISNITIGTKIMIGSELGISSSSPPSGNYVRVQKKNKPYSSNLFVTFDNPNTAGNVIVLGVVANAVVTPGVTDLAGNNYTKIVSVATGVNTFVDIWVATNINAYTSDTITVTGYASTGFEAVEYSGVAIVSPVNAHDSQAANTTLTATLNTTKTCMFFGVYGDEDDSHSFTPSLSPGSVSATTLDFDSSLFGGYYEWLNGSGGFGANNYTAVISPVGSNSAWAVVALH